MPTWPRGTVKPFEVTDFSIPGPLISRGQSGKVNVRSTTQLGRTWSEKYLLKMSDADDKAFLAMVRKYWRAGTTVDVLHMDYQTPNGAGGGSPVVAGASQTGSNLIINGATVSTAGWLKAGDIFTIAGIAHAFDVTVDVSTNASGTATVPVNPPIFVGSSPSNSAVLTITGVVISAIIIDQPDFPETGPNDFGVLTVRFSEAL